MRTSPTAAVRLPLTWAAWSLGLNLLWEFVQLPFYAFPVEVGPLGILWAVLHCTAGDGGIALASFVAAAVTTRRLRWPVESPRLGLGVAMCFGFLWTVQSEWLNVYIRERWAYDTSMPLIAGIGVMPLLQWLLLPPLVFLLVRRSEAKALRERGVVGVAQISGTTPEPPRR
jgi:hypothetical protein